MAMPCAGPVAVAQARTSKTFETFMASVPSADVGNRTLHRQRTVTYCVEVTPARMSNMVCAGLPGQDFGAAILDMESSDFDGVVVPGGELVLTATLGTLTEEAASLP